MNAHSTKKNRYFENPKNHTIFTAPAVCKWLANILEPEMENVKIMFDPCVGSGNLLDPFSNVVKMGADIENFGADLGFFFEGDFLDWKPGDYPKVDLILINPPYNHTAASRKKWGRGSLLPELFVDKCFQLFSKDVKMILFTPMGLRLNTRCYTKKQGDRYRNIRDNWGDITTIVSLPMDCFPNPDYDKERGEERRNPKKKIMSSNIKRKETQQEILFFNMPKLDPHYCLPESVIEDLRKMDREAWG